MILAFAFLIFYLTHIKMSILLKNQKALVLGLGETGWSCVRWLLRQGAQVVVADTRQVPPFLSQAQTMFPTLPIHLGEWTPDLFQEIDLIVVSPGVAIAHPLIQEAQHRQVAVIGDIELFAWAVHPEAKIIAITGSNGKSTVTEMCGACCRHAGLKTVVAGNIGLPILDALAVAEDQEYADVFVLELSSFQLETTYTLNAHAATVLNVTQDHLDRYESFDHYAQTKARIFTGDGVQILNKNDPECVKMALLGRNVQYFDRHHIPDDLKEELRALKVAGKHNIENALATLLLCQNIGIKKQVILEALYAFKGLPHRVEFVDEIQTVRFYDDSKGTNVGATVAALTGFDTPIVLILGGDGKGQDFTIMREAVLKHARAVVLIGKDAPIIEAALSQQTVVPLYYATSMQEAVQLSFTHAKPHDIVLLSPACASFDMFTGYAHRAQVFIESVEQLKQSSL